MESPPPQPPAPHEAWQWDRQRLQAWQVQQFNRQLEAILPSNQFYRRKLREAGLLPSARLSSLAELVDWPLTTKAELVAAAEYSTEGFSPHHTYPSARYARLHRTSGTRGQPLMILDTAEDWRWWSEGWQHVLASGQVQPPDRVFLAFSFGPFIGFWSAHQACCDRGVLVVPGGGLSSLARLEFMRQSRANVVCCTPTYALHLAEVARAENFPLSQLPVDRLIVAGEAGGSLPEVRQRIAASWGADVIDHAGATEIGPWGFGWRHGGGLQVIETHFIAELLPLQPDPVANGGEQRQLAELVLTSLGRHGAPVLRYRTGDVVRLDHANWSGSGHCRFLWLPEGVIGRVDDMVTIRGLNIFPSGIERLVRSIPSIAEYQVEVSRQGELDQLLLRVEADQAGALELEKLLSTQLGLRVPVRRATPGSLPRSEAKSRRWVDRRTS